MFESEDFESLKVTELQNELKKRGLDTKGRKAELIDRLRQAVSDGTKADETMVHDPAPSDDESTPARPEDDMTSLLNSMKETEQNDDQEQESLEPNLSIIESAPVEDKEPIESLSSKKRGLDDEPNPDETNSNEHPTDVAQKEEDDDADDDGDDDASKAKPKKKSRWGSEQDEVSQEQQATPKRTSDDDDTIDDNSTSRHRDRDHDRDYHRSSRQHDDRHHNSSRRSEKSPEKEVPLPEEETVQFKNDDVVLDFYTSDLNLTINTDCLSATNKCHDALCFLWAGTRATYGFQRGKICFEIRINEIIDCPQMPDSEKEKFGVRVGWSNLSSGLRALQLGECNDSFAYTSSGKKMSRTNDELVQETYGESFGLSDILACYIDFGDTDEDPIRISFAKNGDDLGPAFEFTKTDVKEFYPHILTKNVRFECNFGQLENSWSKIKSEYQFAQNVPLSERVRGAEPMLEKSECQVILLSGLNGSGKTTWARKYLEENAKKHFYLLNAESVLSKMTTDGQAPTIKDRNDGVMLRVNICLQKLIEIAAQRRRNYIIDQTSTTRDSQSKHQRLFTGYQRIGVAMVPDEDELNRRIDKLEKLENISIPSHWIKEAKAKFHLPQKGASLEDVIYPELNYDDAKALCDKARHDYDQHRSSSRYDRHDSNYSSRSSHRHRNDDRDRRSRDHDRHARSRSHERDRDRDRDRDRRTSREDSRFSSAYRNDNYRGGSSRYTDYRQDSRNNQRGGFSDRGGFNDRGNGYQGRGGRGGGGYQNQSNEGWGGGYQQRQQNPHQRNDFGGGGGGRGGQGGFDSSRNQFNSNRGSFNDNQRGGGFRQDFNNQSGGRQFNQYDRNQQQGTRGDFAQNSSNFSQQNDRQGFGSRPPMQQQQQQPQQQQQQQQRPQPLLPNPPSNLQPQQQFSSQLTQQIANNTNPNLSLQAQNPMNPNPLSNAANVNQQGSLDSWLALYAAALNPQTAVAQQQPQQPPQQDNNSIAQQWAQWLKSAQMTQAVQQVQPQLTLSQADLQQQQQQLQQQQQQQQQQTSMTDASALYYQAYYAQLAAAQQQAAAAGSNNSGVAPPGFGDKSRS